MAKFCGECGAPLEENARFCSECGATQETAPVTQEPAAQPAPEAFAAAPEVFAAPPEAFAAPPEATPFFAGAAVAVQEKKPRPKWGMPVCIVVAAVAVALGALAFWLKAVNKPEKVAEKFMQAMEAGDFAALAKVVTVEDESVELTEAAVEPLLRLYDQEDSFRQQLEDILENDVDLIEHGKEGAGTMVTLVAEKRFLHTGYRVQLALCEASFESRYSGLNVTLSNGATASLKGTSDPESYPGTYGVYAPEYKNTYGGKARLADLLPGLYDVKFSYDTGYGSKVEGETTLRIDNRTASCYLEPDLVIPDIYNSSNVDVQVLVGGNEVLVIPSGEDGYLGPMDRSTEIQLTAQIEGEEPMTQTFVSGEEYFNAEFLICEVEVYNSYAIPMEVLRDGQVLATVEPYESVVVERLPGGTKLLMRAAGDETLFAPVEMVCEYQSDYIYPELVATDALLESAGSTVLSYVVEIFNACNLRDMAALTALPDTDLRDPYESRLEYSQEQSDYWYSYSAAALDNLEIQPGITEDGTFCVEISCRVDFDYERRYTSYGGEENVDTGSDWNYAYLQLQVKDGVLTVIPD